MNCVTIGLEVDFRTDDNDMIFQILEYIFAGIFFTEMVYTCEVCGIQRFQKLG